MIIIKIHVKFFLKNSMKNYFFFKIVKGKKLTKSDIILKKSLFIKINKQLNKNISKKFKVI